MTFTPIDTLIEQASQYTDPAQVRMALDQSLVESQIEICRAMFRFYNSPDAVNRAILDENLTHYERRFELRQAVGLL
ncbi:hypothetical protein [Chroococcidiopsis sp.]|uniref:hypothetical protein n=1 Tax=Chroococcidiopsis sp. TaxID=3088168 RepID=UPI003F344630